MSRPLTFGICTDQNMTWEATLERWLRFEELGFDSAWDCDHLVQPSRPTGPYFEAWTLLAALAARTSRIRIGVLVTSNTFRHPTVLAKQAVTVDHISGGRLDIGLGAGWYEPEHRAFGIPMPATGELVGRFREAVRVIDLLLRQEESTWEGRYYRLEGAISRPAPVQRPRPPLLLGAFGPRMLKIVARRGDAWNAFGSIDEMRERNLLLDQYCTELERDPNSLTRSLYIWAADPRSDPWQSVDAFTDLVGRYVEAGVNQFLLDQPDDAHLHVMEQVAADVIPGLRAQGAPDRERRESVPEPTANWGKPADYV